LGGDCCDGVDGWCCDGVDGWCCDGVDGWEVGFSIRYVSLGYCVCSDDIGVCSDDVWYAVLFFEKGKNCFLNNDKNFLGKMVFKIGKRCGTRPKRSVRKTNLVWQNICQTMLPLTKTEATENRSVALGIGNGQRCHNQLGYQPLLLSLQNSYTNSCHTSVFSLSPMSKKIF